MKTVVIVCLSAVVIYLGFVAPRLKDSAPQEANASAVPAAPIPEPAVEASIPVVAESKEEPQMPKVASSEFPLDALGTVWNAREGERLGEWSGKWVRRGYSNVFDVNIAKGAETLNFVATVSLNGSSVHAETVWNGRAGSTYDGVLSEDGTRITGTYRTWNGGTHQWDASVTPLVRAYAPDGVVFLLKLKNVTTGSGIIGLPPGTKLQILSENGAKLKVSSGEQEFEVESSDVTNDLFLARNAWEADRLAQVRLKERRRQEQDAAIEKALALEEERARSARASTKRSSVASSGASGWSNPLDRGSYGETRRSNPWGSSSTTTTSGYDSTKAELEKVKSVQRAVLDSRMRELSKDAYKNPDNRQELERLKAQRRALGN